MITHHATHRNYRRAQILCLALASLLVPGVAGVWLLFRSDPPTPRATRVLPETTTARKAETTATLPTRVAEGGSLPAPRAPVATPPAPTGGAEEGWLGIILEKRPMVAREHHRLEELFRDQPKDNGWTSDSAAAILRELDKQGLESSNLVSVDCRSKLCRAVVASKGAAPAEVQHLQDALSEYAWLGRREKLFASLGEHSAAPLPPVQLTSLYSKTPDRRWEIQAFFGREGDAIQVIPNN